MDTPEFQRLRGIKMLGTASLAYPGAVHTRFEHSLGTCHLATVLGRSLGVDPPLPVLAAALLHDVTHIPFGHTIEDERRIFSRHDTPARLRQFLPKGELGRTLKSLGLLDEVLAILTGRPDQPWHAEIVSGTVCADLLDYLARDSYYCGLSQRYDTRIMRSFRLSARGEVYLEACKAGLLRQDVLSEVIHLLRLRYFLSERVYFHHTKTASGAMISRIVEEAVENGLTLAELGQVGDERLLTLLELRFARLPTVKRLLSDLQSHRIYKRGYVLTRRVGDDRRRQLVDRYHMSAEGRREAENALLKTLRWKDGDLILYCPAFGMQLKEADVRMRIDEGPLRLLSELGLPELDVLKQRHQDLWKLYVFVSPERAPHVDRVSAACERYFQEPNHLSALRGGQLYFTF